MNSGTELFLQGEFVMSYNSITMSVTHISHCLSELCTLYSALHSIMLLSVHIERQNITCSRTYDQLGRQLVPRANVFCIDRVGQPLCLLRHCVCCFYCSKCAFAVLRVRFGYLCSDRLRLFVCLQILCFHFSIV